MTPRQRLGESYDRTSNALEGLKTKIRRYLSMTREWTTGERRKFAALRRREAKLYNKLEKIKSDPRYNPGKFARCVESVSRRGGVSDPRAVCAKSIAAKRGRTRGRVNAKKRKHAKRGGMSRNERALIGAGKRLALAKAVPVALLLNKGKGGKIIKGQDGMYEVYAAIDKGELSYRTDTRKDAERFLKSLATRKTKNPKRRNPEDAAAARFEDFHGEPAGKVLEWSDTFHYHGVTSDIGNLVSLLISLPRSRKGGAVEIAGLKGARLTMNEAGTQLFVEGGDQSLDLAQFGVKTEHDREYLGELARVTYHTTKTHLGRDGGKADYVHTFGRMESSGKKTERPQVFYDVLNEEILIAGGGYEIPSEGIDG